jgi:phosphoglycerol transferase MdoB-like AlkP superfamily enzyme
MPSSCNHDRRADQPGRTRATSAVACFVALAAFLTSGAILEAARAPRRASHAFTVVAGATPHVVVSGAEARSVKVTISNDGTTAWDAAGEYALSYHWRTAFGTLVQRDGTRTPIAASVPPGGSITLTAELGPPPGAGMYVLEWDMVQEGVTWFSERDRAPLTRTLVVVLPGTGFLLGCLRALPTGVALLGLLLVWRSRRWTPGRDGLAPASSRLAALASLLLPAWDLAWCASSLFFKQLALSSASHLSLPPGGVAMTALFAVVPSLLLLLFVRDQARARIAWVIAAAGSLVMLADAVYYRFFGDLASLAAVSAGRQANRLVASIQSLLRVEDLWLALDLLVAVPVVARLRALERRQVRWPRRAVAACALSAAALAAVPSPLAVAPVGSNREALFRHLNVARSLGILGYHLDDAVRYARTRWSRPSLTAHELAETRAWFSERSRQRAGSGPYFGAARGRSLVVVLVESLQGFVVGLEVNGQEVTPNLNRLRGESLWSSRVVDQVGEGRTSDAELINAASLLPLSHGAAAFQYPGNHFVSVPAVLAGRGYSTFSAVPFDPAFWNRAVTHPAFGFSRSFFAGDFKAGDEVGWGLNDRSFLQQMRTRLRTAPRPYCAWLITLSLHHPFDSFPDRFKTLDLGRWNGTRLGNYLHAMHLFDRGLGDLVDGLKRDGLLDDTLLVVEGDHEAGAPWDQVAAAAGLRRDTLEWYLADRVPLLIRVPGAGALRGEIKTVAGQADVAPTLLALLGVDPAPLPFIGRNLLGSPGDGPVVRRYGDWLDSRHLYLAGQGYTPRQACFDLRSRVEVPLRDCGAGQADAVRQLTISHRVLTHGLQQSLDARAAAQR